jgi:hypothetical protein
MKRSEIVVGEDYAVVARRTNDARPVRGVVVAVGVERPGKGYYAPSKKDGVRVRFDEPMWTGYSSFASGKGSGYGKKITETVLSPNCFLLPWADQVVINERSAAQKIVNQQEADELGDEYESLLAQADAMLIAVLGKNPDWSMRERQGMKGKRTVAASITLGPRTIIALANLGAVVATDAPKEESD